MHISEVRTAYEELLKLLEGRLSALQSFFMQDDKLNAQLNDVSIVLDGCEQKLATVESENREVPGASAAVTVVQELTPEQAEDLIKILQVIILAV